MARKLKSFSRPKAGSLKNSYEMIIAKRRKGALEIQLNRPDQLNAINEAMAEEIIHAMDAVSWIAKPLRLSFMAMNVRFARVPILEGFKTCRRTATTITVRVIINEKIGCFIDF